MLAFGGRKRLLEDAEWREKIIGAVKFWLYHDFINPNWWHNQIGIPSCLGNIAIMLEDYIDEKMAQKIETILLRGSFKTDLMNGEKEIGSLAYSEQSGVMPAGWTGANLLWGAAVSIKHALWSDDKELLRVSVQRLVEEIDFFREGIQKDGAFCQHGRLWYSAGYGKSYVYEIAPIVYILSGSEFEIPKEKIDIILMHVLDGQRAMMRNGYFDFMSMGRAYTKQGEIGATTLKRSVKLLSRCESISRKNEICDFAKELESGSENYEVTKYYDSICQLCHKKDGVYIGVRGRTNGINGAEECNGEGGLSYNMTYGTITCIMEKGTEYYDISAFWDYSKIPGTTAREESDEAIRSYEKWGGPNTGCRCRGASGEGWGILTEYAEHDGISLVASYFVCGTTLVALGTDIKDENPKKGKLYTTVEQCRTFDAEDCGSLARNGRMYYKNLDERTEFNIDIGVKMGDFSRNDITAPKESVEDNIFTVTIPVAEHRAYAYSVTKDSEGDVRVLRNDSKCQAVCIGADKIMAVFHEDGSFEFGSRIIEGKKGEIFAE